MLEEARNEPRSRNSPQSDSEEEKEVKNEVKQHGHEDSEKNIENLEQR